MITIKEALRQGTTAIYGQQVSQTPLLDASLLLSKTTGLSREHLYSRSNIVLQPDALETYTTLIQRRCAAQPIAYLIGEREFYGRTFKVSPSVLIPRPDTEILVETALSKIALETSVHVLDLCTGSGCIGITIAAERPKAAVIMTDISEEALAVAQINNNDIVENRATLLHSDLFSALSDQKFEIIVTNPPYLNETWYNQTEAQVKAEPSIALLGGGDDGLTLIKKIIDQAPTYLLEGGCLLIECDYRQHDAVGDYLVSKGFSAIESYNDLAPLRRVIGGTL